MIQVLDIIIFAIFVGVFALAGARRGLISSLISIGVMYSAYTIAKLSVPIAIFQITLLIPLYSDYMYFIIFVIIMFVSYMVLSLIARTIKTLLLGGIGITPLSRFLGLILGALLGAAASGIAYHLIGITFPLGSSTATMIFANSALVSTVLDIMYVIL